VTGVEFSERMLAKAAVKASQHQVRAWLLLGDAATPPLAPGRFTACLCRHVLWALPNPDAAIHNSIELLVGDGILVAISVVRA
jgi:SAM-dependent methyltransferase